MPTPLRDKNEIKVFILFLMDKIGYPLDYDTIGTIVVQDGVVRFFDFADAFFALLDTGHIRKTERTGDQISLDTVDNNDLYEITETGKHVAKILGENLMITVREQGVRSAIRHLSLQRLGASIGQNYEQQGEKFLYTCSIRDKSGEVMSVQLRLDDRRQLDKVMKNFSDRPEIIYRGVLALLSGDVNYIFE